MKNLSIPLALLILGTISLHAQLPIIDGDVGMNCFSGEHIPGRFPNSLPVDSHYVFGIVRGQTVGEQPLGKLWRPPMVHHPEWKRETLGEVFGITVDVQGNFYLTATTLYGDFLDDNIEGVLTDTGPHSPGAVYRIDGITGDVSLFADLPNSGPALGNIDYAAGLDLFYVSNFEDGSVYVLDRDGNLLGTYDPVPLDFINNYQLQTDDGSPGFAPRGERIWGLAYNAVEGRLYYSLWVEDGGQGSSATANVIRSVAIDGATGLPDPTSDRHEIEVPGYISTWSNPVSDLSFSIAGDRMYLAERVMLADFMPLIYSWTSWAHTARVLLYEGGSSAGWEQLPVLYRLGEWSGGQNSTGGVDFGYRAFENGAPVDCDSAVWMTGDNLASGAGNVPEEETWVYGLQWSDWAGGVTGNSIRIDADGQTTYPDKTLIGDVEVFLSCRPEGPCDDLVLGEPEITCVVDPEGKLAWQICADVLNSGRLSLVNVEMKGPHTIDRATGDSLFNVVFGGRLSGEFDGVGHDPVDFGQLAIPNRGPQDEASRYSAVLYDVPLLDTGGLGRICVMIYPEVDSLGASLIEAGDELAIPYVWGLLDPSLGSDPAKCIACVDELRVTVPECRVAQTCCPANSWFLFTKVQENSDPLTGATSLVAEMSFGPVAMQSVKVSLLAVTQNGEPVVGQMVDGGFAGVAGTIPEFENALAFGRWLICQEFEELTQMQLTMDLPAWKNPCEGSSGGERCADTLRFALKVEYTDCECNHCQEIVPYEIVREPGTNSISPGRSRWRGAPDLTMRGAPFPLVRLSGRHYIIDFGYLRTILRY